jgi:hypothetical protein
LRAITASPNAAGTLASMAGLSATIVGDLSMLLSRYGSFFSVRGLEIVQIV